MRFHLLFVHLDFIVLSQYNESHKINHSIITS